MKTLKINNKQFKFLIYPTLSILLLYLSVASILYAYYSDRILPGIKIAGFDVGSKKRNEALTLLKSEIKIPEKINVNAKAKKFEFLLSDISFSYDLQKNVNEALQFKKPQNILGYLNPIVYIPQKENLKLSVNLDQNKLNEYLQVISSQVAKEPVPPSIKLVSGKILINKGLSGEYLDKTIFREEFLSRLSYRDFTDIELPFLVKDESLTEDEANSLNKRAEKLLGKTINLENDYDTYVIKDADLLTFIDAKSEYNKDNILNYIEKKIVPGVNKEPQNAVFHYQSDNADESGKVIEFLPAKKGAVINKEAMVSTIIEQLHKLESNEDKVAVAKIPVENTSPEITTEQVNNLGIKELIGRGTSKFAGSIPGRIHNVGLASSKFTGVLLAPGETLSFNKILGDVSSFTGYKQAYIIKDGRTVLGDGGGVCQVSTTLFRAVLNAGLPIVERHAHSYRVGYYEQDSGPGIDATVFDPTSDFRFTNDTPGHILIQSIYNKEKLSLVFEIYGTSDGRISTVTKPVVAGVTAPPPDLYIDDPTLPTGQVKQVDHKAWGAKVSFNYKVERSGETLIDKTFYSNYRPWQSVFMRGTGPAI